MAQGLAPNVVPGKIGYEHGKGGARP